MKQLVLDLKTGATNLLDVPAPTVQEGQLLIQTTCSLVSPGTERMLIHFGKAGWITKARQQPERVKQVIQKIKTDGLKPTMDAVFSKLGQPLPLGYSQVGKVIGIGKNVQGFKVGDRVASNGYHAEFVAVHQQLAAKVPDAVSDEAAAFTVVGAIALQSIRLVNPTFGETVAVIGLGLIGQLTTQLLQANGCRVIGIDIDAQKVAGVLAQNIAAIDATVTDPVAYAQALTNNIGVDAVIITASSDSDVLISQAARMCRKRGRVVLTGVVGLHLNRADFFEKEISFQVSCSYGPGRYDPVYEQQGHDYPIGYVRWTEQRNFEAVLQALATGQLKVQPLISRQVALADFGQVYDTMGKGAIASLLLYDTSLPYKAGIAFPAKQSAAGKGAIGLIGAGAFTGAVLLPALKKKGAAVQVIASRGGLSAASLAQKFNIAQVRTDDGSILADPDIHSVFITTQHQQHAPMVIAALNAGKHVFVEKPLAIDMAGLEGVMEAYKRSAAQLYVGFNRRFAPLAVKMNALLQDAAGPLNIIMTVNAGALPERHWLHQPESGGRLIGEACHFIDLGIYLAGSFVTGICANAIHEGDASILLRFENGSNAVIHYFTNGSKAYDKERIEVYSDGRTLILENWKKLRGFGFKHFSVQSAAQDKGHQAQFNQVIDHMGAGTVLIPFEALVNSAAATIAIPESIRTAAWINIPKPL